LKRELRKWCDLPWLGNRGGNRGAIGDAKRSARVRTKPGRRGTYSLISWHSGACGPCIPAVVRRGTAPNPARRGRLPREAFSQSPGALRTPPCNPSRQGHRSPLPLHPHYHCRRLLTDLGRWFRLSPRPRRSGGDVAHLSPETPIRARCSRVKSRRDTLFDTLPDDAGSRVKTVSIQARGRGSFDVRVPVGAHDGRPRPENGRDQMRASRKSKSKGALNA
jgi:hypothetical protein